MAEKHIFIGLGGAGVNTVTQVKYKIYAKLKATPMRTKMELLNEQYRFLFIDTDDKDIRDNNMRYRDLFENGRVDFINPLDELINLGDQNPHVIYKNAQQEKGKRINKRIQEACNPNVAAKIPNMQLANGAGAFRVKSRIAFARKLREFHKRLHTNIRDLNRVEDNANETNSIYYWVIGSSNGGTGSGIINDVLYYVNMIHRQVVRNEDPQIALMLYMPQYYIEQNSTNERYPKNAYAVFSELETFQRMSKVADSPVSFHRLGLIWDYHQFNTDQTYRPFYYCVPIDYQVDNGNNMGSLDKMYQNTAEMIYYMHSGPGGSGFRSIADNYINEIQLNNPSAFLIPMGYIALRKPEKEFEDYMQIRMRYELIRYGLIGRRIESDKERDELLANLYTNVIRQALFDNSEGSFAGFLNRTIEQKLEDGLPESLVRDGDKVKNELPASVSLTEADRIIEEINQEINRSKSTREMILNRIEAALWKWIEENSLREGLEYVNSLLFELDSYCTELYNGYISDQNGKEAGRKSLQRSVDEIAGELDDLYEKAVEITVAERLLKKNKDDVNAYFLRLRDYVTSRAKLMASEQIYELLNKLCVGDNGLIDHLKRHVSNLLAAAKQELSGERGAQFAYEELAKSFLLKKQDVTSVYLPDISDFADGFGWKDNHTFARLYHRIIEKGSHFERGLGYEPQRANGEKSMESLMHFMISHNRNLMLSKGYLRIPEKGEEESALFCHIQTENYKKTIEDMLLFASNALDYKCKIDVAINEDWYRKTLPQLFDGLDLDRQKEIRGKLNPNLFFSHTKERETEMEAVNIYVAPTPKIAEDILGYKGSDRSAKYSASDDPFTIYILKAQAGFTFQSYRPYATIKEEYDKTQLVSEFHFHDAFAACRGDYRKMNLPAESDPVMIALAKFLLMDGMKEALMNYYYASADRFDQEHYTNTPFLLQGNKALVALLSNVSTERRQIVLKKHNGQQDTFLQLVFNGNGSPYTAIYQRFKNFFTDYSLGESIHNLIREMERLAGQEMEASYYNARKQLMDAFNEKWSQAKDKDEQLTLVQILSVLRDELAQYEMFINEG